MPWIEAHRDQHLHRRCDEADERRGGEDHQADEQGRPPAAAVAHGAGDQLAETEPDEEGRDAESHGGLGRAEGVGRRGHRRQEEVGRERPQGPEAAEDEDDDARGAGA